MLTGRGKENEISACSGKSRIVRPDGEANGGCSRPSEAAHKAAGNTMIKELGKGIKRRTKMEEEALGGSCHALKSRSK